MKAPLMAAALLAAALPGRVAAQVECPTAADLQGGIRFQVSAGESETFRLRDNGLIETFFEFSGTNGDGVRALLAKGVYLLELVDFENGEPVTANRTTYSFPLTADQLPDPEPGAGWSATVAVFELGEFASEAQVYRFGQPKRQIYGVCGYDMFPIEIAYPDEKDPKRKDVLHYLPELGLSYLAEYHDRDESSIFTYFHIEKVTP